MGSAGDEGGVQLATSETATTGCMFFMEMDGRIIPQKENSMFRNISTRSSDWNENNTVGSIGNLTTFYEESSTNDHVVEMEIFDKVLVVEDSKFNRKMMTKALTSYAKEIVLAEDGVEAVTAVRGCITNEESLFDVIFMDSLMPNMNGIDATKIILRELKFPNPIIAITGNMLPEDVKEFKDVGVFSVLGKPLELDKLDAVLKGN
jgi:CheY-like chemotaxis protein